MPNAAQNLTPGKPKARDLQTSENSVIIDDFPYRDGDRRLVAIYDNGMLLLRAMTPEGVSCNVNLDAPAVHRLAISLARFLDIHKFNLKAEG